MSKIAFLALTCFGCLSCANDADRSHTEHDITNDPPLIVQHRLTVLTAGSWTVETWLNGSSLATFEPIKIYLRFAASKGDPIAKPRIRVRVVIVRANDPRQRREFKSELTLDECSKMARQDEVPYFGDGRWGERKASPTGPNSWVATIENPFPYNLRDPREVTFSPGNYLLAIEGSIANDPPFAFKNIPIEFITHGNRQNATRKP